MSEEPQRVAVIHDASRDVTIKAIQKALKSLSLKPGDELILLPILDRFSSPSMFPFRTQKLLGYMMRADETNDKILEEELAKKKVEYPKSSDVMKISELCEGKKILFHTEVHAGQTPEVAYKAVKKFEVTWLILDRQMNKHKRYFMDRLPCGMYKITDNSLEKLRALKQTTNFKSLGDKPAPVRYMGMIPGGIEEEFSLKGLRSSSSSEQLIAIGGSSIGRTKAPGGAKYESKNQEEQKAPIIEQETVRHHSLFHNSESKEIGETETNNQKQYSNNNEDSEMEAEFTNPLCSVCNNKRPTIGWKRDFSYAELHVATHGFSDRNFLSEGGFGSVYKGQIDGMTVAVKQHKNASLQGEKEFKSEVNLLSKAIHENVVMLLGSCSEGNNRLLVYEYVCNGSLDQHLSQHSRTPLSWENRIKIAIGAAKGLMYLHDNNIIHRDMRPNNILITHDHQPLLGDFGLARTQHEDSIHSTEVIGALGYLAPEYAEYGKVSAKTDVYSFGVVLLELITGMRTTDKRLGGRSLVGWARPLLKEKNYPDLIDERITNSHDVHQLYWMVRLAEKCLSRDPRKRLRMSAVFNALNRIAEGSTCGLIIRGYSPARSESSYASESSESEGSLHEASFETGEEGSSSVDSISFISMSQIILRPPPSPPIGSTSSSGSSTPKFYHEFTFDTRAINERDTGISQNEDGSVYAGIVEEVVKIREH